MTGKDRTPMVPPRQTTFSPHLENLYQAWAEFIMRGTDTGLADLAQHYPDTYKLPNHKSFSNESIYSTGKDDPYWIENPAPYRQPTWKLQGTDIVEQPMNFRAGGRASSDKSNFRLADPQDITIESLMQSVKDIGNRDIMSRAEPISRDDAMSIGMGAATVGGKLGKMLAEGREVIRPSMIRSRDDFIDTVLASNANLSKELENWRVGAQKYADTSAPYASRGIINLADSVRPITPEQAGAAFDTGRSQVGSRFVLSGDVTGRSVRSDTSGLHYAGAGDEITMPQIARMSYNKKKISPSAQTIVVSPKNIIHMSDAAGEFPDILAKDAGLTDEYFKLLSENKDITKSQAIMSLLRKYGVDSGVYANKVEDLPSGLSYTAFDPSIMSEASKFAEGGRVNFDTGGLNYPDYGSTTTAPLKVTAERPSEAERIAYFASHDADGNLIIPNEFAPPNIPHDTVKAAPPHAYNLPNEYSIPRLGAAGVEALTTLGTGLASYIGGGLYGIGANIGSGKYGTPEGARIGEEVAGKVAQDYTYQPRTQAGQDTLEGMGNVMETFKIPPLGFPELSMLPGMRRMIPTDVQVIHGRTKAAAQGAKQYYGDPVADYYNAGQGITRDYPTLGAAVQRKAKVVGDVATRASENLSTPSTLNKQAGAIFPEGAPKRMVSKPVDLEGRALSDEDVWPRFRGVHGSGPAHLESQYIETLPEQLGLTQRDVQAAWEDFKKNKAYEMYPDAPDRTSAVRAFQLATPTFEARRAIQDQWLDEFSNTNQLGMPSLSALKVNEDKAVKALETTYPNMVAKYLGQENADPMVLMAAKDLPLTVDKKVLIDKYISLRKEQLDEIRTARTAAGLPPEGKMQEKLNGIKAAIEGVDQQLAELTATKWDMERQWTDRDTQPAPEGYAELTRHETKLTNQKKILERQAREMETAPAIEAFHDLAVVKSMSPSEMKSSMDYPMTQFHPYLALKKDPVTGRPMTESVPRLATEEDIDSEIESFRDDAETIKAIAKRLGIKGKARAEMIADPMNSAELRDDTRDMLEATGGWQDLSDPLTERRSVLVTPESAMIVQPRAGFLKASGLEDVMKDYAADIYLGKTNKSPEQYMLQKAQELKKVRDDKAAAEAKREELTKANYMSYVNAAPADKVFGNYVAIEFDPSMSAEELGKGLSIDSDVLNHCVGSGGVENGKHFGIWDPATGLKREGIRSPVSNEMNQIMTSGVKVTSIRDRATGLPVVTVKMVPDGRTGKYSLNFVNGERNGVMDYKGAPALRDYLNSKSDVISNYGSELTKNGVYDLKTAHGRHEAAIANNMKRTDVEDFVRINPDTPRFATKDDVKAMKPQSGAVATRPSPTSAESLDSLMEARDNAQVELDLARDEGQPDNVILDLRQRVADIDARLNAHPDTVRANNPVTDERITEVLRAMPIEQVRQRMEDWYVAQGFPIERAIRNADNHLEDHYNDADLASPALYRGIREQIRATLTAEAPATAAAPIADAEITNYINNMDEAEIRDHLIEWANDNAVGVHEPIRDWVDRALEDPTEIENIPSLRETVRAQLENNPEELQNLRELMGDWEPEAPMTLPAPATTIDVLVDEYDALPSRPASQNRAEAIRGQIINNVTAVNPMDPTISDLGAMELIGATTGIRPSELLASAVIRNSTHLGMGSWSIGRRTQLQNFINQHVENQANNVQALPPAQVAPTPAQMRTMIENATPETIIDVGRQLGWNHGAYGLVEFGDLTDLWVDRNRQLRNAPAMADLVNELSSLTQLVRPDMDQYTRTDTLTDEIIANARPHVIPFTGAETPDEIANRIARLNSDIPPTLLAYLIGRRTTAEDVFGIRGLPDPLIHEVRAHLDTMHPANVPALPSAEQAHVTQIREMIGNATEAQGLNSIRRYMDDLGAELSIDTLGTLSEELATRQQNLTQQELNNAPAAPPTSLPEQSMVTVLAHIRDALTPMTELRELQQQVEHPPIRNEAHWLGNASERQLDIIRRAIRYELAERMPAERITAESIMLAPDLDALQRMADALHDNRPEYTNEQVRTLERLMTTRAQEITTEPDMQLTGLTPQTAMQTRLAEHLAEMQLWTDEGLRRNIRNLTEHHPQTIYADLNEELTAQALRLMQTELESRGLHMAHGGVVHKEKGGLNIRPSGGYNDYKDQYVKVKRSTTGIDIDLLDKYGIGATKQKLNVTLPEGKIKQSDISELRARYKTDSGDQYNISYSPLEKRASLSKPNPKDQSEWRADFSPVYKGISYNRNFAQGGVVYDEQHVSKIANELLGAMNG